MKIVVIIGARPQFIKHAPFEKAAKNRIELVTVHTGQHYDDNMSTIFFSQLKMDTPNYLLNTGGGGHGEQTGKMLQELEPILIKEAPDFLLVYGDTNSTLAGALVGAKLHIPIIHVEAGLRSYNKKMPEEINRILTDHISEILISSTMNAKENLRIEGIVNNVHIIGDIMTDAVKLAEEINSSRDVSSISVPYYYVTIHRPYNTDKKERIIEIINILDKLPHKVVFPIHPRTRKLCKNFGLNLDEFQNIHFVEPMSYFDNVFHLKHAIHAITDSGGLQKEAYILKTACITIRSETEWTETLVGGWNVLCYDQLSDIPYLLGREMDSYVNDLYGSGNAALQIVDIILEFHSNQALIS